MKRLLFTLSVLLFASTASAQTEEEIAARRLALRDAEEARRVGNHAQALEMAQRAASIQMTPSLRMFIVREQNHLGQHAEALLGAQLCLREVQQTRELQNAEAIRSACTEVEADARRHAAQLRFEFQGTPPAGISVRVNGTELRSTLLALPRPVNPGTVRIEASAPNYGSFSEELQVTAGEMRTVHLALRPENNTPSRINTTGAWVTLGVGGTVALAGLGTYLGYSLGFLAQCTLVSPAMGTTPEDRLCPNEATENAARNNAFMEPLGATMMIVGGAGLVAGGIWAILATRPRPSTTQEASLRLLPLRDGLGLSWQRPL